MISKQQLQQYRQDGVLCLRQAFQPDWVELARAGIERNMAHPGRFFRDHTEKGSHGRYVFDFWNWPDIPEFQRIMFESPLGPLGREMLDTGKVRMLMDNWFVREAGCTSGAPWHHDEPYFDFEGHMCIVWMPLESVSAREGLTFIRGSHDWGQLYIAEPFSENVPFQCSGERYQRMPDFDTHSDRYEFLSWDLDPGDCLVFDFRTIHRASETHRECPCTTHRMTFRMGAADTVFEPRGEWTREISDHLIGLGQTPGAQLDNPLTPLIVGA